MDTMPRDMLHVTPLTRIRTLANRWLPHAAFGWLGVVWAAFSTLAMTMIVSKELGISWVYAMMPGLLLGWIISRTVAHCRGVLLDDYDRHLQDYRRQDNRCMEKHPLHSMSYEDRMRRYERYRFSNGADRFTVGMLYLLVPFLCIHFLISLLA